MANRNPGGGTAPLYLEDLRVGQRFVSGTHQIDEGQIRAFAGQFDPQPFHLDAEAAQATLFGGLVASGWHTAAVTMRLLVEGGLPPPAGSSGPAVKSPGPTRRGRATSSRSRARSSSSGRRGRVRTGASQPSGARRATSGATPCRCSLPGSLCRVQHGSPAQTPRLLVSPAAGDSV